jgi:hypothetical protein
MVASSFAAIVSRTFSGRPGQSRETTTHGAFSPSALSWTLTLININRVAAINLV